MDLNLGGKTVIVSGGSAGIGLASAKMYLEEGCNVVVVARDAARLAEAASGLLAGKSAERVLTISADLAKPGEPERVVEETIARFGVVDILVNNVGVAYQAKFHEVSDEQWDSLWQLNVMSFVRFIRAVLPSMRERKGGCIINVSSTAGKRPSAGMANYSVTKAAVLSLSRLIADTYAGDGIRSVAICPGPTRTPAWLSEGGLADQVSERSGVDRDSALDATGKGRPIGRMAEPEEIASAIVFASSPASAYTTGAAWSVDGGSVPVII